MYLDFVRRTQRYDLRRHPRSREIPKFATRVYHFTLSGVSQFGHPVNKTSTFKMGFNKEGVALINLIQATKELG